MSQHWSRALLDIEVAYDTSVDYARGVIKCVADEVWQEDEGIEIPFPQQTVWHRQAELSQR